MLCSIEGVAVVGACTRIVPTVRAQYTKGMGWNISTPANTSRLVSDTACNLPWQICGPCLQLSLG